MKRFIAALFVAIAYAQDDAETDAEAAAEEGEGDLSEGLSAASDWWSSRQEPVEFTSDAAGDCSLAGNYHWYQNAGIGGVVVRHTVSECDIADGAQVLTWAQIENPETPGDMEGFYCVITFSQENATARETTDVETQQGAGLDYANFGSIVRTNWCTPEGLLASGEAADCERQGISTW